MTDLESRIRETVFTLQERIEESKEALRRIRVFCKHNTTYVDMARSGGELIPCRICAACSAHIGEPTAEEKEKCLDVLRKVLKDKESLS